MTTKCTGLMGRIFGHKWKVKREATVPQYRRYGATVYMAGSIQFTEYHQCQRCGAVTGGNHGKG